MTQSTFSKRYGYISSDDCVIRESLPNHIKNAIQNCFTELFVNYNISSASDKLVADFGRYFLNLRIKNNQHKLFAPLDYVDNCDYLEWYEQIDVFEWTFNYHFEHLNEQNIQCLNNCIIELNKELERHHYAYRVINGLFIEVTSDIELEAIEKSLSTMKILKFIYFRLLVLYLRQIKFQIIEILLKNRYPLLVVSLGEISEETLWAKH